MVDLTGFFSISMVCCVLASLVLTFFEVKAGNLADKVVVWLMRTALLVSFFGLAYSFL